MSFIDRLKTQAKQRKKTIVLPETTDVRTLEAAIKILNEDFAHLILLGDKEEICAKAKTELGNLPTDLLQKATFLSLKDTTLLDELITLVIKLREHKGVDSTKAKELLLNDSLYFGAALVRAGKADGMVAGATRAPPLTF